jgi:hypothetical protein
MGNKSKFFILVVFTLNKMEGTIDEISYKVESHIFYPKRGLKMVQLSKELVEIVNLSMPFPADVLKAYSKMKMVFTSGDLATEASIPRSTAKYYVKRMIGLRMISKVPYRKKYQKYANASNFSDWLQDLIRLAIRPLEES